MKQLRLGSDKWSGFGWFISHTHGWAWYIYQSMNARFCLGSMDQVGKIYTVHMGWYGFPKWEAWFILNRKRWVRPPTRAPVRGWTFEGIRGPYYSKENFRGGWWLSNKRQKFLFWVGIASIPMILMLVSKLWCFMISDVWIHRSAAIERLETNISNIPRQDVLFTASFGWANQPWQTPTPLTKWGDCEGLGRERCCYWF